MGKNKMNNTQNNKKEDGKFKKKNIKHGHAESSRSAFGSPSEKDIDDLFDID
ncbi:CPC_1213 family protein [Clostridium brassicae]|uniref:CPC_1213 family protein n=1 Tax=Clostridium brassicae TaxID=2999072 RepID=A0ABT4DD22_9CLOT|nr:CPC_1213 family protein [Clostridium brassicae]MCY6960210.1 CPC_1213 family protein [Clostridium brassicae]